MYVCLYVYTHTQTHTHTHTHMYVVCVFVCVCVYRYIYIYIYGIYIYTHTHMFADAVQRWSEMTYVEPIYGLKLTHILPKPKPAPLWPKPNPYMA